METVYKLTDKDNRTFNRTLWGENVTHTAPGTGELCSRNWLHAYADPLLAVLLNPAHGNFDADSMKLWVGSAEVRLRKADKLGCTKLTTLYTLAIPVITTVQKQAFAIFAAKAVYKDVNWITWANAWLSGEDRSKRAAQETAAAYADAYVAYAATATAAYAAAYAATAADAAYAAAYAATAADAAYAAAYAATAAATAADAAYGPLRSLDLVSLAHKAVEEF